MVLFEALKAFLFGVVEGITEWLPISSTGHMMLLDEFVKLDVSEAFYSTFLVVIQLGAILAVILLFFHKLNPFSPRKNEAQKRTTWNIWAKVVVGSIPAAIVGLLLDDWIEERIMTNEDIAAIVVASALIVYGVIFIAIELRNRRLIAEAAEAPRGKHARTNQAPAARMVSVDPDAEAEYDASSAIAKVNTFDELFLRQGLHHRHLPEPGDHSRHLAFGFDHHRLHAGGHLAHHRYRVRVLPGHSHHAGLERAEVHQARLRLHGA